MKENKLKCMSVKATIMMAQMPKPWEPITACFNFQDISEILDVTVLCVKTFSSGALKASRQADKGKLFGLLYSD